MTNSNNINGWLSLHKPSGITSARAVSIVKRKLPAKKVGHAGTLDPLASGVLPLALGEATKTVQYAMLSEKGYDFTVKWGEETDSFDSEGKITSTSDARPSKADILKILPEFIGDIKQTPPAYSAIKVNGRRAYDLARKGEDVKLEARNIHIKNLKLVSCDQKTARFQVSCGKGTYIRSLSQDIASKLGAKCHVIELIRTNVGKFDLSDAILLDDLEKTVYKEHTSEFILPVEVVLDDIPVLPFTPEEAIALRQGKRVIYNTDLDIGLTVQIQSESDLIAIAKIFDGYVKAVRVFNHTN